jgi:hypothetical protein
MCRKTGRKRQTAKSLRLMHSYLVLVFSELGAGIVWDSHGLVQEVMELMYILTSTSLLHLLSRFSSVHAVSMSISRVDDAALLIPTVCTGTTCPRMVIRRVSFMDRFGRSDM